MGLVRHPPSVVPAQRSDPGHSARSGSGRGRSRCHANAPASSSRPSAMNEADAVQRVRATRGRRGTPCRRVTASSASAAAAQQRASSRTQAGHQQRRRRSRAHSALSSACAELRPRSGWNGGDEQDRRGVEHEHGAAPAQPRPRASSTARAARRPRRATAPSPAAAAATRLLEAVRRAPSGGASTASACTSAQRGEGEQRRRRATGRRGWRRAIVRERERLAPPARRVSARPSSAIAVR